MEDWTVDSRNDDEWFDEWLGVKLAGSFSRSALGLILMNIFIRMKGQHIPSASSWMKPNCGVGSSCCLDWSRASLQKNINEVHKAKALFCQHELVQAGGQLARKHKEKLREPCLFTQDNWWLKEDPLAVFHYLKEGYRERDGTWKQDKVQWVQCEVILFHSEGA